MHLPPRQPQIIVAGLHLITLVLLGLHLYVRTLPPTPTPIPAPADAEAAWWGFWPFTYLPAWAVAVSIGLIVGVIILFWVLEIRDYHYAYRLKLETRNTPPAGARWARHPNDFILWLGVSVLLVVAFFAFPIAHTRWGDAYLLSKAIAWPDPAQRLTYSWQAPLDVFLHSQIWLHWHELFRWKNTIPVYRLLSPIAGMLYLSIVLALTRSLQAPAGHVPAWLTFGLLATLGLIQLFFGYIENYSFMAVGILAYLWLALAVLAEQQPLWLAATVLALTHATHPSTLVLAPSLLYCGWHAKSKRTQRNQWLLLNVLQIALPMLIVATITVVLMQSGGHGLAALFTTDRPGGSDASFFVPLWKISSRWQHYTMFSWLHVRDVLNEQMLVAPAVLPGLLWILAVEARKLGSWVIDHWVAKQRQLRSNNDQSPTLLITRSP